MKPIKVASIISKAGIRAFEKYYEMSDGDCWVNQTPEYWYSTAIAKGLSKSGNFITLENPVKEIRETANAGGKKGRATNAYNTNGRADVTIWDEDWLPEAIIEVKRAWSWDAENHGKDIDRICASLIETGQRTNGTIKYGMFVIITDFADKGSEKETKKALREKFDKLKGKIDDYLESKSDEFICKSLKKNGKYYKNEGMPSVYIYSIFAKPE